MAAGLSLARLADGDVTRALVHLIERGQSRPSIRFLRLIASRTGRPLSFFASDEDLTAHLGLSNDQLRLAVDQLEILYETDRYGELISEAERLLEQASGLGVEPEIRYWTARGLTMLGKSREALIEVEIALAAFEERGDHLMVAECLDCKASALYLRQDRTALATIEAALAACDKAPEASTRARSKILSHLAAIHLSRHEWQQAVSVYERAIDALGQIQDLGRAANLYEGMSVALNRLGDAAAAVRYSQRAISMYSARQDRVSLANAENNLAFLLLNQGQVELAHRHVQIALDAYAEVGHETRKANALLTLAEIFRRRGDRDASREAAEEARALAMRLGDAASLAAALQMLALEDESAGNTRAADQKFREALKLLVELGQPERLVEAHSAYADLLQARGNTSAANKQLRQALSISRPAGSAALDESQEPGSSSEAG
jgi:tetratricopeptide (TPR) repeat protein